MASKPADVEFLRASWDEVPNAQRGGPASANPFLDKVQELYEMMPRDQYGKITGRSEGVFKVILPNDEKLIEQHLRWLYRAARKFDVSAKKEIQENDDGKVTVFYWTAPKIHRPKAK